VVDAARNRKSPLHPHFEWDDTAAAEAYRLDQARNLIRIVRVADDEVEDGSTRAFISINDKTGTAYRPIEAVRRSADLQFAVLRQARRDLDAFEKRYRELSDICVIVAQAREAVDRKIRETEHRAAA
jgi:hypothetical protein